MALAKVAFGVFLPFYAFRGQIQVPSLFGNLKSVVLECERLGYDSVWLDDHLMFGRTPILESWTTLSALASATSKIRLGTMVTANGFRNPALLAKMSATVDVVSNGRIEFGVGLGVQKDEHLAYGYPFQKPSVRAERLKESVEIVKQMWTQEKSTYAGKHYNIVDAVCEPKPLQKPHPRIVIAGSGEKHTLNVTALYADRLDFGYLPTLEEYRRKLQVLKAHCESVGRDFNEIEKSCWPAGQLLIAQDIASAKAKKRKFKSPCMSRVDFEKFNFVGTPDDCAALLQPYLDLGVTYFMLFFADLPQTGSLRLFADTFREMKQRAN